MLIEIIIIIIIIIMIIIIIIIIIIKKRNYPITQLSVVLTRTLVSEVDADAFRLDC